MAKTNMKKVLVLALLAAAASAVLAQMQGVRRPLGPSRRLAGAQQQQPAAEAKPLAEQLKDIPKGTNGVPVLNFENAPLELVLMQYAMLSEKVLLPAPNLPKAQITLLPGTRTSLPSLSAQTTPSGVTRRARWEVRTSTYLSISASSRGRWRTLASGASRSRISTNRTVLPSWPRWMAHSQPARPPPMTTTSSPTLSCSR